MEGAIEYLSKHYPDPAAQSNKSAGGSLRQPFVVTKQEFCKIGMKQSFLQHMKFDRCRFENVALTGSQFRHVHFQSTQLTGSSFACCDFFHSTLVGTGCEPFTANNFSFSNFEGCQFSNIRFISSGMLNSTFHNSTFSSVVFQSSTLEGTEFLNCEFCSCDLSRVNVEFSHFQGTKMQAVSFPFYQFPYVIGAADYLRKDSTITLRAGEKEISCAEYCQQLERLITYFMDKSDCFPVCNLYIALGNIPNAKHYLLQGITYALEHRDFRMIKYFCQLALHHELLDSQTRQIILQAVDDFLLSKDIPVTQRNYYMTYAGNIRTLLYSNSANTVTLHFNVKTNVDNTQPDGVRYVNDLMSSLNQELVANGLQHGFQIQLANYSPYEIVINVLSAVGSVASIASLVWQVIATVRSQSKDSRLMPVDTGAYQQCVDAKIDAVRANLLRLQKEYSAQRFSKYIRTVTQQLKTDLDALYSDDIMIFKVTNQKPIEEKPPEL